MTLISDAALKFFTVSIDKVPTDRTLRDGQMVTIKITSVAYSKGVPSITGELVSTQQVALDLSSLPKVKLS